MYDIQPTVIYTKSITIFINLVNLVTYIDLCCLNFTWYVVISLILSSFYKNNMVNKNSVIFFINLKRMTSLKYLWKQSIFLLLAVWRHHPEFLQHPHSLLLFSCSDILPIIKKVEILQAWEKNLSSRHWKMSCILKKPFSISRCEIIKMSFHIFVYLILQN